MIRELIELSYFNNQVADYLISLAILIGSVVVIKIADLIVIHRLKKITARTESHFDDRLVEAIDKRIVPLLYLGAVYLSIQNLNVVPMAHRAINIAGAIVLTCLAAKFILSLAVYSVEAYWKKRGGADSSQNTAYRGILTILKLVVWILALVILLDNFGVKVSALVAGLGIGGLALAFAAQKVLGDLFSYFSIFFDRPFEIGDFVIVGEFQGTVEHIGIKSTRVRSLGGEQLIFANTDLTNSRLRNYKRMINRRVVFKIGITYDTPAAKVKEIPGIIGGIIKNIPCAIFDRAHFASYGDFSLNFEVVYYVEGGDYLKYMDTQQQINLAIMEAFAKKKIEFAYPTQTLFVNKK
ncbi:MAG: mechanosensitive ion channel protein MscS [Candidatus Edwardsbacteria bacterium RIFOXYD12_FULL_50_11]|uniref:Mechanosensitive ion channel protein MscS n=1 Tax=Candidatus Edwardsbacteria bacterium GWF2_54_11 TaxID=1817851 RepID=A0A1F5RGX1_9BACT|nr:MAG: mechanosensitive ion channel protein MscS [Candidatus Edwardsbacteria bacterium RifOxyC12_full_54_24]OGF07291.1 MAG: mechanosensitive ion channel protein MscS [Candidatus Edwardsbacteria bacterium RifOxyA12_full_54_48]OGF09545.1 MAG: mechanosensitive ion channel protein MscS [Candidatus Edwardsbacteria bacterium GWE2_54_12]OGF13787.1 MAG: mechanosensitive ion channel protein MscS [Candidatus Edwardsbacteria bacterium GWF2_54_11]OGF17191.1 MAG: mechanosensitive ion channel protein MscS [